MPAPSPIFYAFLNRVKMSALAAKLCFLIKSISAIVFSERNFFLLSLSVKQILELKKQASIIFYNLNAIHSLMVKPNTNTT